MEPAFLEADVVPFVSAIPEGFGYSLDTLSMLRSSTVEAFAAMPLSDDVERTQHVVSEEPPVGVRVHRPKGIDGPLPCIYAIHGGGYVSGSPIMEDSRLDRWCQRVPCVGVAVEYRVAPEVPYPGALDDCYAGLVWTFEHVDELGIDRSRIGVSGASAGGGLSAAVALLARDRGEMSLAFQLLECPMLDDRQSTSSSQLDGLPCWSRESNEFGWRSYLGDLYSGDVPAHAAPSRATELGGLPPALVIVGGADGFRDEDVDYALRLNQAGVPAELHVLPGGPHGVQFFQGTAIAARWNAIVDDWLERQLRS